MLFAGNNLESVEKGKEGLFLVLAFGCVFFVIGLHPTKWRSPQATKRPGYGRDDVGAPTSFLEQAADHSVRKKHRSIGWLAILFPVPDQGIEHFLVLGGYRAELGKT